MSRTDDVDKRRQSDEPDGGYLVDVHNTTPEEEERRALAVLLRKRRALLGMTQEQVADAAGISRQTYIKYEMAKMAANPRPQDLRAVCQVLELDPREIVVALGFVTREELGWPPAGPALPSEIEDVISLVTHPRVPDEDRAALIRLVDDAVVYWMRQRRHTNLREPSHEQRTKGTKVTKR